MMNLVAGVTMLLLMPSDISKKRTEVQNKLPKTSANGIVVALPFDTPGI